MTDDGFTAEQEDYLKGFMAGVEARRGALGLPASPGEAGPAAADPDDLQRQAQDRTVAGGGKLVPEEEAKRKRHPLDRFDAIAAQAAEGVFPKGTDIFLAKYHGLFYVAPAQKSFMCRLRLPGGLVEAHQLRGIAAIAEELAGGYADITTRANLQLREIPASAPPELLIRLAELGLTSRGAGADNIRNITGSPTAGIDPQELVDTRPTTRAIHHHILNTRALFGLPRKFNIAVDGGGRVAVLEDSNDIALAAAILGEGHALPAGVVWRLGLGGITGHGDLARDTGVAVPIDHAVRVCDAIVRVFIAHGNRTDRTRARLKYLLDDWGIERFLTEVEAVLGAPLPRIPADAFAPRPPIDKHGHVGIHAQKQPGRVSVGVTTALGRLQAAQLRGIAAIAERFGSRHIRLTVWQNFLLPDIAEAELPAVLDALAALDLGWQASALRGGLVACTGNAGCRFAASDTKRHAAELAAYLDPRLALPAPVNIHLTGCHHSCAQHRIADIGLLATKIERGEDSVEGYDLFVGGGAGPEARIGRAIRPGIAFDALGPAIEALLAAWLREAPGESFQQFCAARDDATLASLTERIAVPA